MTNSNRLDAKKASNSNKVKSIDANVIRINFAEMSEKEKRKIAQQAISENVKKFYW